MVAMDQKLALTFPDEAERAKARAALLRYGRESHHQDPVRVRLAILKLSGGDLRTLEANVTAACTDHRDVLAWAECPEAMSKPPGESDPATHERDRAQYERWLNDDK